MREKDMMRGEGWTKGLWPMKIKDRSRSRWTRRFGIPLSEGERRRKGDLAHVSSSSSSKTPSSSFVQSFGGPFSITLREEAMLTHIERLLSRLGNQKIAKKERWTSGRLIDHLARDEIRHALLVQRDTVARSLS